ncbi:MAG: M20/M25/M40 family metallo-hydrolase [Arenicella sp.]|nr:M20/M25/M40 family metallo-hydrolase [Arenicella sp.]
MKKLFFICLCAVSLFTSQLSAKSTVEQRIADQIEQDLPLSLSELEQSVNINSGTLNFAGVREVGHFFLDRFDELGFKTQWIDGSGFGRAGHLVATHLADNPEAVKILMIGHLDTVFSKTDEFQQFKRLSETEIAGPGITDMKGGNVIIVAALRALKKLNLLNKVSIKIVMTGDEESSGEPLNEARHALVEAAIWADIALGFEDGDGDIKTAVVARRGSVDWSLQVTGKPAHSSQIFQPEIGYGAVFEAARIINEFRQQLAGVGNLTFNPGLIIGGTEIEHDRQTASGQAFGKNNVIAQTVKVTGGLRALSAKELNHAKQTMQNIVAENLPHTSAELVVDEGYPPMAPTEGNYELLGIYSEVSQSLGYGKIEPVNPRNAGAADISFAADHVVMALDGLGLMGSGGHTRDEVADISSLSKNTQKAAILIYRLSQPF